MTLTPYTDSYRDQDLGVQALLDIARQERDSSGAVQASIDLRG
jgi:hypothetical protein